MSSNTGIKALQISDNTIPLAPMQHDLGPLMDISVREWSGVEWSGGDVGREREKANCMTAVLLVVSKVLYDMTCVGS